MGTKLSPSAIDRAHRVCRTYIRKNDGDKDESRSASDNDPKRGNTVNEDGADTAIQATSGQTIVCKKGDLNSR